MTNAEILKSMTDEQFAMFLFKWQVVCSSKAMELKFNELLDAKNMVGFLKSNDNSIIYDLMSADWHEKDIDFTKYIKE